MTNSQINSLIKMLEKSPNNPLGRYGLANEYFKIGEFGKAIDQLNIYFELKDDEGSGYRLLAESYLSLDEKEKAKQAYQKGIEAAHRHGHPSMADEFEDALDSID